MLKKPDRRNLNEGSEEIVGIHVVVTDEALILDLEKNVGLLFFFSSNSRNKILQSNINKSENLE